MIVVDTGPLVAAAIANDQDHERCVALFTQARQERTRLLVPSYVAAETCYMLEREGGAEVEAAFLRSLDADGFESEEITDEDRQRMADLVERYADLRLGGVDAAVIAIAERVGTSRIATLNHRDFTVVRPKHVAAFALLPEK